MTQTDRLHHEYVSRKLWDYPWGYAESFIIASIILIVGITAELFTKDIRVSIPEYPTNIYIIGIFVSVLVLFHLRYRDAVIIEWISSVPAALSAVILFSICILIIAFIPQNSGKDSGFIDITGLAHQKNSCLFILVQLYLLTSLGMVVLRRSIPFKKKNIGFILNHLGLWIVILAIGAGSADLKRVSINLFENGASSNIAFSEDEGKCVLPFVLKLIDFDIDQYNPHFAIIDLETKKISTDKNNVIQLDKNKETIIDDWRIRMVDYMPIAIVSQGSLESINTAGGYPCAKVIVESKSSGSTISGTISSGSPSTKPDYLQLNKNKILFLTNPQPKRFYSKLVVSKDSVKSDTIILEVNKPYSVKGWDIYQIGYDEAKGKWSTLSIIDAVKDPWLPLVYVGMYMLMAGAIYLFWIGKNKSSVNRISTW